MLYEYKAIVREVYDGDTITVDIDLGLRTWRCGEKIRLFGINAPELRGDERAAGLEARDRLRELILNKQIILRTLKDKTGKYGRWIGEIFLDGTSINQRMVGGGYAKEYDE